MAKAIYRRFIFVSKSISVVVFSVFLLMHFNSSLCLVSAQDGAGGILVDDGFRDRTVKTVAIITDGPSVFITPGEELVIQELRTLVSGQFDIKFKRVPEYSADWELHKARQALRAALADDEVDLILASGIFITMAAAGDDISLSKPVISTFLQKSEAFGLSYTAAGKSEKPNLSFVVIPNAMATDLKQFRTLIDFDRLHILADEKILSSLPRLDAETERLTKELKVPLTMIPAPDNLDGIIQRLESMREEIQALYVTPQVQLSMDDYRRLYPALARLKIPTFSLLGHGEVALGALAAQFPDVQNRVARRTALNLHQILLGVKPQELTVYLPVNEQLLINAETARAIGFTPNFQTLISAEFIHREVLSSLQGKDLTLESAMELASQQNVDIGISKAEVESARQVRYQTRGALFPQLVLDTGHSRNDEDRARLIRIPERRSTAGVTLRQLLFSDEVFSQFRVSTRQFGAEQFESESRRLDVIAGAGQRFLDFWATRELLRVEVKNLNLTRDNLNLARLRAQIGAGGPEEVLRWEANEARQASAVLTREAAVRQALVALNQSLGFENQEHHWTPVEIGLEDDHFYFLGRKMPKILRNMSDVEGFRHFAVKFALENEPALHQAEQFIDAQRIVLNQLKRQFVVPTVSASLNYDRELDRGGANGSLPPTLDRDEWTAAVGVSIPLYEGGARFAETKRARADLDQLIETFRQAKQLVEQRVHTAMFALTGSHPAVQLSQTAAERSASNLEIVREKYAQGTVSITELLDAQTQAFTEEQNARLSVIEYLKDLIEFQRAIAWFEFEQGHKAKEIWLGNLEASMSEEKIHDFE